jgi:primosomal replication protein N
LALRKSRNASGNGNSELSSIKQGGLQHHTSGYLTYQRRTSNLRKIKLIGREFKAWHREQVTAEAKHKNIACDNHSNM